MSVNRVAATFFARRLAILFRVAVASTPRNPSTEEIKGEKYLRFWRHASRYMRLFAISASCKHFSVGFTKWDLASVYAMSMS